jgi:tRNA pseudouridine38-40 synthase
MRRIALKFGYDGSGFSGYQRQPSRKTVEGEIIDALQFLEAIDDVAGSGFQSASRTDTGVHAVSNAVAFSTEFEPHELIHALNARCGDIYFHSYLEVPATFNPRRALMRHYRYLLPEHLDEGRLRQIFDMFAGATDFRNFAKSDAHGRYRRIERITVSKRNGWTEVDFLGRSFLHNMVRRITGAALCVLSGKATQDDIREALNGGERVSLGLAKPEFLILMDVDYGMSFHPVTAAGKTRMHWTERLDRLRALEYLYREFRLEV